jgi:hypothetical protein
MMAPADPDASTHGDNALVHSIGPRILELFPLPGNIYESARYFYNSATDLTQGDFAAVLAFAAAHGHPSVVHECWDLQEFQAAHPLAVVRSFSEVSLALLERGWFLLMSRGGPAPPVPTTPAPQVQDILTPTGQASELSNARLPRPSMAASCGGDPPLVAMGPRPLRVVPPPVHAAPSVWGPSSYVSQQPDSDGSKGHTFPVRGAHPAQRSCSSSNCWGVIFHP